MDFDAAKGAAACAKQEEVITEKEALQQRVNRPENGNGDDIELPLVAELSRRWGLFSSAMVT